jgi:hypothetical protein
VVGTYSSRAKEKQRTDPDMRGFIELEQSSEEGEIYTAHN